MYVEKWDKESRNFRKQFPSETTYSTNVVNGELLFQIQTYAASQQTGGAKQTIQFNKQGAIDLIEILKREFNLPL
ncbi:MAG: hypothetical protein IJQ81_18260 [Oscillibacter sp.]|nr:hypothetical protein [Oscillibacter sp.]